MKYVKFELVEQKPRTSVWEVRSHDGYLLGEVKWYPQWRQYCFFSETDLIFSASCLEDIAEFVNETNAEHKRTER